MGWFWEDIKQYGSSIALLEGGRSVSYDELSSLSSLIADKVESRSLIFCICENTVASVAGYFAFLQKKAVPVLLSHSIDSELYNNLIDVYRPQYIWCPSDFSIEKACLELKGYKLIRTGSDAPAMDENLAIMLTTSGSTGSPF